MENRREKAYSFSYCLFAYIYKDIHQKTNLPVAVDYTVPSTKLFKSYVGDCVLNVCRVHKTFINPVFSKIYTSICVSETQFFEYVRWYYEKVACNYTDEYFNLYAKCNFEANVVGPFFIKLLTLCSFIAELVRLCFEKKCYSFTSSGPTSLAEIILTIPEIDKYFPTLVHTFIVLNQFCYDVISDAAINANSLCNLFMQQANILQENHPFFHLENSHSLLTLPPPSKISSKVVTGPNALSGDLYDRDACYSTSSHHRQSNKRKSDELSVKDYEIRIDRNSESLVDFEMHCKLSNVDSSPECVVTYKSKRIEKSELGNKCPHCKEQCLSYLVDFVEDFKETNYEDE